MFLQVIASVLRNLSWRADVNSKKTLREVGSVRALTGCALVVQKVNEEFIFSRLVLSLLSTLFPWWSFAGVHSEVSAECSVEPVCSLYREQGGHLRRGRCAGLSSGNADPLQSHQHTRHHRERRRDLAECFQPYRHQ